MVTNVACEGVVPEDSGFCRRLLGDMYYDHHRHREDLQ